MANLRKSRRSDVLSERPQPDILSYLFFISLIAATFFL